MKLDIVKILALMIALQAGLALPALANGDAAVSDEVTLYASDTTTAPSGDTGEDTEGEEEEEEETEEGAE